MRNTNVASKQRTSFMPARSIVRWAFLPFMLVGLNGAAIVLAGRGAPKWQLVVVVSVGIGVSFAAERLAAYRPEWNQPRGDALRDLVHALVNELLQLGSLLLLPGFVAVLAIDGLWPAQLPFWVQVLASVVALDAGITFAHWWSHRWKPLWRLHAVHHSIERFYGFNGLMKHPLHQLLETMVATTPLVLVGLPADVASALVVMVAVQLLIQHSNVDYRTGALDRILAVNRIHRFHHLRWPGVGDVNFGLFLTLWDRVLGTHVIDPVAIFTSSDLGIAAEPDYPVDYLAQLARPFQPYTPIPEPLPHKWQR